MRSIMATGLAVMLLMAANAQAADLTEDEKALQGSWTLVSGEADGEKLPEKEIKGGKLVLKGNDYTVELPGKETVKGVQKLDSAKDPGTIDITDANGPNKGKTCRGLYKLTDDEFRVVFGAPGKPRPTKFATEADSGQWMHVWKKTE